jgi:orotidine-5'-phosphate decarboxylase
VADRYPDDKTNASREKLIVALDFPSLGPAIEMARRLRPQVTRFKVGMQLFTAEGPRALERLASLGVRLFLDLKFHDIPNTVRGAVAAAADLPAVDLLTVHALGGAEMLRAASEALASRDRRPKLLAITLLTSLSPSALSQMGLPRKPGPLVLRLGRLARRQGLDGLVCSAEEARRLRRALGPQCLLAVPGIRPLSAAEHDQARTATPSAALRAGADLLIVGRPITRAASPEAAAAAILAEIASALDGLDQRRIRAEHDGGALPER